MNILQKRIQEASQKYYSDGTSDLSDAEFDNMLERLRKEDPNSPLLNVGHGYDINKNPTSGARVQHKYGIAGSLDKCHSWEEIPVSFITDDLYHASLKLDGLSMVLYYKDGVFYQALTRGGGPAGIDKTNKIKYILDKTELHDRTFTGAVRGEVVMSYDNFELYRQLHPKAKNPRNSAAGIINSNEIVKEELALLDIVVYTVVGCEPKMPLPNGDRSFTYADVWSWLEHNFTHVANRTYIDLHKESFIDWMNSLQSKWYGKYPADGIVIARNDLQLNEKEGNNQIEVIYQALAFKFKAESETSKIIGIEWNLTKTKYLVPRVNIETVQLSGTNVSWATGSNALNMKEKQLGIGAEVSIIKSGEIIPYIDDVITPVPCELPTKCPCCGADLIWNGVHLQCPNLECADADIQDTLIWMKFIAPRDGLGDTLKLIYLEDMLGDNINIESIYMHGPVPEGDIETRLIKKTEFNKMFNALFTNKVKLSDAIQALNIPRFGDVTSNKLAQHPDIVSDAMLSLFHDSDANIIGAANYESMCKHRKKFERLKFIKDNIDWAVSSAESKGKVAITGKLSVKRSVFEDELRAAGFTPTNISKDTSFLITDNPQSSSDKNKKADQWGITKITEQEFRKQYM